MTVISKSTFVVLLTLAGTCLGQRRVWVVDITNAPGTDFVDLPPAEAAAANGDVILIRHGLYTGIATSKALSLIGSPLTTFLRRGQQLPALEVFGLPAGQQFSARDLTFAAEAGLAPRVTFRACAGTIVLQRLGTTGIAMATLVSFDRCTSATVSECGAFTYSNGFALAVAASRVAISASTLRGQSAVLPSQGGDSFSTAALAVYDGGQVQVADTAMTGGGGVRVPTTNTYRPSSSGLHIASGAAWISRGCRIDAGTGITPSLPVSAVSGNGSVDLDPTVPLTPYAGAPPIGAGVTARQRPVSGLSATGGSVGNAFRLTLRSEPATLFVLAAGLASAPIATPFGDLFLEPQALLILAVGSQGSAGATVVDVALPSDPRFFGQHVASQAATTDSLGRTHMTNPAAIVAR